MRKQRSYIQALKDGGADPADIQAAQARYLNTMHEYKGFCAKMDMRPDMQRVYIDGLGRMSGGRIAGFAENSLKNRSINNNYSVAWEKVRSKEYNTRINKVINNKDVADKIATSARKALINRDGKDTEELYALNIKTGKDIASITNQNNKFGVARTKKFQSDIERAKDRGEEIVYIHNHPGGSPPSIADLNQLVGTNDVGIIAGHNGNLYYYTAPDIKINKSELKVATMKSTVYNDNDAIRELAKQHNFDFKIL